MTRNDRCRTALRQLREHVCLPSEWDCYVCKRPYWWETARYKTGMEFPHCQHCRYGVVHDFWPNFREGSARGLCHKCRTPVLMKIADPLVGASTTEVHPNLMNKRFVAPGEPFVYQWQRWWYHKDFRYR